MADRAQALHPQGPCQRGPQRSRRGGQGRGVPPGSTLGGNTAAGPFDLRVLWGVRTPGVPVLWIHRVSCLRSLEPPLREVLEASYSCLSFRPTTGSSWSATRWWVGRDRRAPRRTSAASARAQASPASRSWVIYHTPRRIAMHTEGRTSSPGSAADQVGRV